MRWLAFLAWLGMLLGNVWLIVIHPNEPWTIAAAAASVLMGYALFHSLWRQPGPQPTPTSANPLLASIVEAAPEALLCYSNLGDIQYANHAARELFLEGADYRGCNFLELVSAASPAIRGALLGPDDHLFTLELDGWPESYHLARRPIELPDGVYTWLSVTRMTQPVGRREAAVLRRVIRVLSHEVNNSLAPILSLLGSSRLLLDPMPESPRRTRLLEALEVAAERARHLATFIEGYGRLARLPEPKPRNVEWQDTLQQLRGLYPGIVTRVGAGRAWFDPVPLEQVLVNLVKNALEAGSPENAIEVDVSVGRDGSSRLEVRDRGGGFAESARTQAFVPLYTTKQHGSGMGLALCKEIVEAHGGNIGLGNLAPDAEGRTGAKVRLFLPGRPGEAAELHASRLTLTRG